MADKRFSDLPSATALADADLLALSQSGTSKQLSGSLLKSYAQTGVVLKDATTGSAYLPTGTTAQRTASPTAGLVRYNSTTQKFEGYGSAWGNLGGGAAIGDTAPANPGTGDLWWNSATGHTFVFYGSAWVDLFGGAEGQYLPLTGGTISGNLAYTGTLTGGTGVINIGSGQFYKDAAGNVGVGVTPAGAMGKMASLANSAGSFAALANGAGSGDGTLTTTALRVLNNAGSTWQIGRYEAYSHVWGIGGSASASSAMTLDAFGNFGLGTTSPTAKFQLSGSTASPSSSAVLPTAIAAFTGGGGDYLTLGQYSNSNIWIQASYLTPTLATYNIVLQPLGGSVLVGQTNNPNSAKIASSGPVAINNTSGGYYTAANSSGTVFGTLGLGASYNAASLNDIILNLENNAGRRIYVVNRTAGVYLADGGTSWTSNSDERLKDIIEPISNAVQKVSTLRTVIGKYKTDESDKRRSFLIAQDVQKVLPEAISQAEVKGDDTEYLGVQYTDTIPLIVAAIKELTVRLEALEAH